MFTDVSAAVQAVIPLADTAEGVQESWAAMQDELHYWREEREVLQVIPSPYLESLVGNEEL